MDTAEQEYDRLYKTFMQTERHTIHQEPFKVFDALGLDLFDLGGEFIQVLKAGPDDMQDRLNEALDEFTQMYVMHCVSEEMEGV